MVLQSHISSSSLFSDRRIVEFSQKSASGNQLQQELAIAKKNYQQSVLAGVFDFSNAIDGCKGIVDYLLENIASFITDSISWTEELLEKLGGLQVTAKKFQTQLRALFQQPVEPEENIALQDRIKEIDKNGPGLNSIIQINPDAIQIAEELDAEMKQGKVRGPLHGIPVVLKDNIDTHDNMATTGGSKALMNSYPLKDSYIAKQLRDAGAVIIGKANLSEWANFRGQLSTSG